jgi:hypothetical protein
MGAAWVPLQAYPIFFKKKILYTGQVRVGYGLGMGWERAGLNEAKLRCFGKKIETLYLSLSLTKPTTFSWIVSVPHKFFISLQIKTVNPHPKTRR